MRLQAYLKESKVKITRAQADEIEMSYETMIEDGRIKVEKKGSSYFLSGDLKTLAGYIENDYHPEYGLESVSKALMRSMRSLGNKIG